MRFTAISTQQPKISGFPMETCVIHTSKTTKQPLSAPAKARVNRWALQWALLMVSQPLVSQSFGLNYTYASQGCRKESKCLAVGVWSVHLLPSFSVTHLRPGPVSYLDRMSTRFCESELQVWSLAIRSANLINLLFIVRIFIIFKITNLLFFFFCKQDNVVVTLCSFIILCPSKPAALQPAVYKWGWNDKGRKHVSCFSVRKVTEYLSSFGSCNI